MKYLNYFIFLITILVLSSGASLAGPKKIVYSSSNSNNGLMQIFIMDDDGSNKQQITNLDVNCYAPKFSPDGQSVVFYTDEEKVYYIPDIYADKIGEPKYVFPGTTPSFAPSGDYIIFNAELDGPLSIYAIAPDDYEPEMISPGSYSNQQVFSRDANYLVFSTFYEGSKCIFIIDLNDTTENALMKVSINSDSNLEPDISSNGDMVVYASFNSNLKGTICLFQNGKEKMLTKGVSWNHPVFSPNDSKIACIKIPDEESTILVVMDIDGSNKKELNIKDKNVGTFQWIDSENIIFDAENGTESNIGVINITTGKVIILAEKGINIQPDMQKDYSELEDVLPDQ
jgi:TolB protein